MSDEKETMTIINHLTKERNLLKDQLQDALSTLHSIASMTVFCDDKETYEFCLDEAKKMATEVLDDLDYKCNCKRSEA